jgi:hypothetical protein
MVETNVCEGHEGFAQIPNPDNCQDYYICLFGSPMDASCEGSQIFDIQINECNNPENSICIKDKDKPTTTTTIVETNVCEGHEGVVEIPNPDNCQDYYICLFGSPMDASCEGSQIFDIQTNGCNDPEESICIKDKDKPTTTTTTKKPTTTVSTTSTKRPSTTTKQPSRDCPIDQIKYIAHENDCSKFYQCYFGQKNLRKCPVGQFWNDRYSVCTKPSLSGCRM